MASVKAVRTQIDQIQKYFTEMFLIMPSTKIAQIVPLRSAKGCQSFFKWHLLLNHWSNFKIISQKCSSWCPLLKLHNWFRSVKQKVNQRSSSSSCPLPNCSDGSAWLNKMPTRDKNKLSSEWYLFNCMSKHHLLMCQNSGEHSRALLFLILTPSLPYISARNMPGGNTAILILIWCYI